jgi:hypothetical protein
MNVELVMDFTILAKQSVVNYKILNMDVYLTMCLCNVCETLGYKIFEVVLTFVFHNIKYATLKIFCKVNNGIKIVDFLDFVAHGHRSKKHLECKLYWRTKLNEQHWENQHIMKLRKKPLPWRIVYLQLV